MSEFVEFRHLKYILAVAETANFTRAAERLFLAQPSLSHQIKELEEKIGFPIFERTRQGVLVTPAGRIIVNYARHALAARVSALDRASAVHHRKIPVLRIGYSSFVQPRIVQVVQAAYSELFPACEFQLISGSPSSLAERLSTQAIDCALLPLPVPEKGWRTGLLKSSPLVVCMRADDPLSSKSEVRLSDVMERVTIYPDPHAHPMAHTRLCEMFAEVGIEMRMLCSAATPFDAHWMVRNGLGLALVEEGYPLDRDLITRRIAGVTWTGDTAFISPENCRHLALDFIDEALQERSRIDEKTAGRNQPIQLKLLA